MNPPAATPMAGTPVRGAVVAIAFVIDLALVVTFTVVGRASHAESILAGIAQTAWPFVAALLTGWVVMRGWRAPLAPVRTGVGVWVVTVAGAMLLRSMTGQGTAIAFVIVTLLALAAGLIGWRALAVLIARLRRPAR